MTNKNYNELFKEELKDIRSKGIKPTLFLHACCGPCLTYPLSILKDYFKITVGYFNPNIQPQEEYKRRLDTLLRFVKEYSKDNSIEVDVVVNDDVFSSYNKEFVDRYNDVEGGNTCLRCHRYRMNLAYKYACQHGFDYFTTVMTVSSKKPSREINEIGEELEKIYHNCRYLFSDFKKEDGQLKGINLSKKYNMYRQDYCGCLASLKERNIRKDKATLSENKKEL